MSRQCYFKASKKPFSMSVASQVVTSAKVFYNVNMVWSSRGISIEKSMSMDVLVLVMSGSELA